MEFSHKSVLLWECIDALNIRPNGPCYNTHVDIEEVRAQLEKIIIPKPKEKQ